MKTRIMAELVICGDKFDTDMLTDMLGISPTKVYKKGDIIPPKQNSILEYSKEFRRKDTAWKYSTGYLASLEVETALTLIRDLFEDKVRTIQDFIGKYKLEAKIVVVPEIYVDEVPAFYFSRDTIAFICSLDGYIDMDAYVYVE